jgi:acetyltransferase-like isoleucine patch superfamily enzyme
MGALGNIYRVIRFKVFSKSNIEFEHLGVGTALSCIIKTDGTGSIQFEGSADIWRHASIYAVAGAKVVIGDRVRLGEFSNINGDGCEIRIGANTLIGQHVQIIGSNHKYLCKDQLIREQGMDYKSKTGVIIGEDCWISSGAYILPGVKIGDGAVIGALSVVTKDVEPYSVVAGNPARKIKMRQ